MLSVFKKIQMNKDYQTSLSWVKEFTLVLSLLKKDLLAYQCTAHIIGAQKRASIYFLLDIQSASGCFLVSVFIFRKKIAEG